MSSVSTFKSVQIVPPALGLQPPLLVALADSIYASLIEILGA